MADIEKLELKEKELQLKQQELELKRQELDFQYRKEELSTGFGKFGFMGTLIMAVSSMILVAILAVLAAYTPFEIESWVLAAIIISTMCSVVFYGYFSLRRAPQVDAKRGELQLTVGANDKEKLRESEQHIND